MTWNLWWRFGNWEQRQRAIVDTIREADPDVVCLQEVWKPADMAAVQAATTAFEHQLWPEASEDIGADPGCDEAEMDKLIGCVEASCSDQCSGRSNFPDQGKYR